MKRPNQWHVAIMRVIDDADPVALTVNQIMERVIRTGIVHHSKDGKATLCGRIAELRAANKVERIGRGTYRKAMPVLSEPSAEAAGHSGEAVPEVA